MPSLFLTVLHDAICNRQTILVVVTKIGYGHKLMKISSCTVLRQSITSQGHTKRLDPAKKFLTAKILTAKKFDSKLE
jgi:hypothetical protein